MKNFIWNIKQFGVKVALDDIVIGFCKWFVGAKRIRLTYYPNGEDKYPIIKSINNMSGHIRKSLSKLKGNK